MRDFIYHRAASLDEASRLVAERDAMLLAGGQTLLRDMKRGRHSPASLVDIGGILPKEIALRDGAIVIGAGATHAEVTGSSVLQHLPVLAALVDHIGDPAVRHRGTLGGALAANEPAGDYPAACLALGANVHTTARTIAAADFFVADGRTVLAPGEIITAATFPIPKRAAYIKFLDPAARYAMVGVFASCADDGRPAIAVTGASVSGAFRWQEAEKALIAGFVADNLRGIRLAQENLAEDLFADAAYRSHLAGVLARRAVELARRGPAVVVLSHGAPVADAASNRPPIGGSTATRLSTAP
jgi:carbon-monoxide dehydrogenase medium subunit